MTERDDRQNLRPTVADLFDATASYWADVYDRDSPEGRVYVDRQRAAEEYVSRVPAPLGGGRALEIGSGAGRMTVHLAGAGWRVDAVDVSEEMTRQTRDRVDHAGVGEEVTVRRADVEHLDGPDAAYDLAVSLGVLPWLDAPDLALASLQRVLRPGGWLVLTSDNRHRLTHALDPLENPWLRPLRRRVGRQLRRARLRPPLPDQLPPAEQRYSRRAVERMLTRAGFRVEDARTVGFWPFTFFHRRLLGEHRSLACHLLLQRRADRGWPVLRGAGGHLVVLARRL